jgi:putative two-component system response regulator
MGPDGDSQPRRSVTEAERGRELEASRVEAFRQLALAAEYRDGDNPPHIERVGATAAAIAERLGFAAEQAGLLLEAAALHDVGKLAIPDTILLKPNRLTEQEFELVKTHAALGASLLSESSSPVLQMASVIAASHHERWDGTGYPAGLAGEAIPLVGRVVAVADVFDALTHDRPYKSLWPLEQAISEVRHAAESQFDPRVVGAFLEMLTDAEVAARIGDQQERRSLFQLGSRKNARKLRSVRPV